MGRPDEVTAARCRRCPSEASRRAPRHPPSASSPASPSSCADPTGAALAPGGALLAADAIALPMASAALAMGAMMLAIGGTVIVVDVEEAEGPAFAPLAEGAAETALVALALCTCERPQQVDLARCTRRRRRALTATIPEEHQRAAAPRACAPLSSSPQRRLGAGDLGCRLDRPRMGIDFCDRLRLRAPTRRGRAPRAAPRSGDEATRGVRAQPRRASCADRRSSRGTRAQPLELGRDVRADARRHRGLLGGNHGDTCGTVSPRKAGFARRAPRRGPRRGTTRPCARRPPWST